MGRSRTMPAQSKAELCPRTLLRMLRSGPVQMLWGERRGHGTIGAIQRLPGLTPGESISQPVTSDQPRARARGIRRMRAVRIFSVRLAVISED
jgi:hypothetical protein